MKVFLNGAAGAMGLELQSLLRENYAGGEIAALVDSKGGDYIYTSFDQVTEPGDIVVDFSFHSATAAAVSFALSHNLPLVVGTTGHTDGEKQCILDAAKKIPVFYSGNMSLGIAVLCKLVKETAKYFPKADIEILEVHHNRKADAPSGTALMLARAAGEARPQTEIHCGRAGVGKRTPEEIGISSIRLGNTVGIHEVMISTGTQTITLKHEAHDRALFAQGALEAAAFLIAQKPGLYNMDDLTR